MSFGAASRFRRDTGPLPLRSAEQLNEQLQRKGWNPQRPHEFKCVIGYERILNRSVSLLIQPIVFGDGGYVKNRRRRPERSFEVVAGKALERDEQPERFALVRKGGSDAVSAVGLAFRRCGANQSTAVNVLSDGDAGLRAIHQQVAPHADHILDWFQQPRQHRLRRSGAGPASQRECLFHPWVSKSEPLLQEGSPQNDCRFGSVCARAPDC